jgi:hypothetical protein
MKKVVLLRNCKNCEICVKCPFVGRGKHLTISQEQVEGILRHYTASQPKIPQAEYFKQSGISQNIYWRVSRFKVKQEKDRKKVLAAAEALGFKYNNGSWERI